MKWPRVLPLVLAASVLTLGVGGPSPSAGSGPAVSGLVWKRVPVSGFGAMRLHIPADWDFSTLGAPPRPVDVTFRPAHGKDRSSEIHLSILAHRPGQAVQSRESLRADVERVRNVMMSSATPEDVPVRELQGGAVTGWYFSMTDRAAAPSGGWRYMTYGSGRLGNFVVTFNVTSNVSIEHQVAPVLTMLRDMEREPPSLEERVTIMAKAEAESRRWQPVERSKAGGTINLTVGLPDKDWEVWVDLHDYRVQEKKVEPDKSSAILVASHPGTSVGFSATVERVNDRRLQSSQVCMAYLGQKANVPREARHEERDGMHVLQYDVSFFEGAVERDADAYLYRDGTCIDVHIHKDNFRPSDQPLFDLVLNNIKIVTK
jgi:hypothetical protein